MSIEKNAAFEDDNAGPASANTGSAGANAAMANLHPAVGTHRVEYMILGLLALIKFLLPFLIQDPAWEPHRDEFLYLVEARHMAWGFMEVPPLLSVFAWLTNFLGGSMFVIKLWPSLFGAMTYVLTGRIILSLGGRWFALILGWLPFIFGAYLRMHFLFQPNFLDIFFWTAMAYGLVRFKQTGRPMDLYLAGISLGLGMLSKFSMAFYGTGLIAGLILTWDKKVIGNRHFYYALIVAFLIFLPNLVWEFDHGFPVVYHMKELQRTQLQYVSPVDFLTSQIKLNLPAVFVWIAGLSWAAFSRSGRPFRFVAWAFAISMLLLVLGHGKSYYSQGAYPILFAFGAPRVESFFVRRRRAAFGPIDLLKISLFIVMLAFVVFTGYIFVTIALPFKAPQALADYYARTGLAGKVGALKWEDQRQHSLPQDYADMLSWKEMTQKVAAAYNTLDSTEKSQTLLFCDNYGQAGAVSYYGPPYHLPEAYSDNASFLYWLPDNYNRFNVILLVTDDHHEMEHPFIKEFQSAVLMDSIVNPFAREHGSFIILLKGPNDLFRKQFDEKIDADRNKTDARRAGATKGPI